MTLQRQTEAPLLGNRYRGDRGENMCIIHPLLILCREKNRFCKWVVWDATDVLVSGLWGKLYMSQGEGLEGGCISQSLS